ncbi:MAG: hypothetical protein B7X90_17855 [Novosphingobium sp. 17-62-19]|uniref:DUF4139 domain-containing protein n=1 Tax=Novosphingobium sp. 17-62-19 TaxID=1970406 RepID=UPI000BD4BA56|nr:hypothetical protein [Novosphingobium sp. 17-62-19]OYX93257.1 MAG: hypothetical protein B7Y74_10120 [Novosphingobium sp. 35-62-5]OZA16554.1 MAG: hypothetical protein B7X90_17855 [Novosphingobium sp. 17-62-19]HQS98192.1 hypothetical protein [Novosphingobium sp.]
MRHALALALLLCASTPALGQSMVTSSAPDSVSVSVYRAPDRASDRAMELSWLEGYALITEKRTVEIPAGKATIRFEGVAAGLFPESAIVTGLPSGVREKNLDADLLSPRSLYARMFGRPVTLRRTLPGNGGIREERAVIRSAPDGAAILQTAAGFEVANCGGLDDEILYVEAPKDLSARPTLSIETESTGPQKVTLSLSYLAWGFDWQSNYVIHMNPDGRTADLAAWVTLASSDSSSFADAETAVIAGEVNREDAARGARPSGDNLVLQCNLSPLPPPPPPPPPPPMAPAPAMMMDEEASIMVTGMAMRAMKMEAPVTVVQEGLGDLKLYRVPVPVTVAANAQKQVALAQKTGVKMQALYRAEVWEGDVREVRQMLRTRNRKEEGLGLPLPGGPVTVFEPFGETTLLAGEGGLQDRAVGEDVEILLSPATQVTAEIEELERKGRVIGRAILRKSGL